MTVAYHISHDVFFSRLRLGLGVKGPHVATAGTELVAGMEAFHQWSCTNG